MYNYIWSAQKNLDHFAALTTKGYFWTSWSYQMTKRSICVMPPLSRDVPNYVAGVCSDYIERYK